MERAPKARAEILESNSLVYLDNRYLPGTRRPFRWQSGPDWCFLFAQIHNKVHSLCSSHFRERESKEKSAKRREREEKNREVGGEGKRVHATAKQIHWVWRKQMLWKMKLGLPILNPQASIWWWSGSSGGAAAPPAPPLATAMEEWLVQSVQRDIILWCYYVQTCIMFALMPIEMGPLAASQEAISETTQNLSVDFKEMRVMVFEATLSN